ncbi:hypothetical protein EIP91_000535 [Steccherinum ochraceum]|uniref:Uncharacterized protein n=1 Tax=Steccherinum ochraceum TaxID=92696 RepID=A0A4R0RT08_9APHY|nr:hypothetical protein EIP91_000535 [Steccherinum ochraceum]
MLNAVDEKLANLRRPALANTDSFLQKFLPVADTEIASTLQSIKEFQNSPFKTFPWVSDNNSDRKYAESFVKAATEVLDAYKGELKVHSHWRKTTGYEQPFTEAVAALGDETLLHRVKQQFEAFCNDGSGIDELQVRSMTLAILNLVVDRSNNRRVLEECQLLRSSLDGCTGIDALTAANDKIRIAIKMVDESHISWSTSDAVRSLSEEWYKYGASPNNDYPYLEASRMWWRRVVVPTQVEATGDAVGRGIASLYQVLAMLDEELDQFAASKPKAEELAMGKDVKAELDRRQQDIVIWISPNFAGAPEEPQYSQVVVDTGPSERTMFMFGPSTRLSCIGLGGRPAQSRSPPPASAQTESTEPVASSAPEASSSSPVQHQQKRQKTSQDSATCKSSRIITVKEEQS